MTRRLTAIVILGAWVLALGWLARRQFAGPTAAEDAGRWLVPPGSSFLGIRLGDRQVGFASVTVDTVAEGLRVVELTTMDLPTGVRGKGRRTSERVEAVYNRSLQLRSWRADLLSENGRSQSEGAITGDTLLSVVSSAPGQPAESLTVLLRRPVVLPGAIPLVAASRGLPRTGSRLNVEVFDPFDLAVHVVRLTVASESLFTVPDSARFSDDLHRWTVAHSDTVRAWRLDGFHDGLPLSRWIDGAGMPVRQEYPLGATLERSAFELVSTNFRALPPAPWDSSAAAPDFRSGGGQATAAPPLDSVRLGLAGGRSVPVEVPGLIGGTQRRSGDTLWLTGQVAPVPDSMPTGIVSEPPLTRVTSALSSTVLTILGRERRPVAQGQLLKAWIRRTIAESEGDLPASAERVLLRRSGSADDRVTLLAGLLRASGIEARPVWGLVREGGRWRLRSWVEAEIEGRIPIDPADAGGTLPGNRVRLGTQGRARLLDLALLAGRLRLEPFTGTP